MSLTLVLQAPDLDALRHFFNDDLPALAAAAAERPGISLTVISEDGQLVDITERG